MVFLELGRTNARFDAVRGKAFVKLFHDYSRDAFVLVFGQNADQVE